MHRAAPFLVVLAVGLAASARADDRLTVRVVTLDAVEGGGPTLGAALAGLRPDVACLQSVWSEADAQALTDELAKVGLAHAVRFPSRLRGSGLLIASRWPVADRTFKAFTLAGEPHRPFASDWWDGPGVGRASLDTPLGRLLVADARLHARGDGDEFFFHQLAQALEAADAVGDHGARPPEHDHDPARPPLLLAGRLDLARDALPWRLLVTRADLTPVDRSAVEAILYRPGGDVAVTVKEVAPALDGRGLLAELELRRLGRAPRPALRALTIPWRAAAAEARPLVAQELEASRERGAAHRSRGLVLLVTSLALMAAGWRAKQGKRRGCLLPLLALVPLHAALWSMYLGAVHERLLERGLVQAAWQLEGE